MERFVESDAIKQHVDLIREVFLYAQRFRGGTFVLHIDYAINLHGLLAEVVKDLVLLQQSGIRMVLVPGASQRIDEILAGYGIENRRHAGVRISPPEAIPFIKMAAFDVSNHLMTLLTARGTNAVIGNWVRARSMGVRDGVDYGDTGTVDRIKLEHVQKVLDDGLVPIFPCVGWNAAGKPYNISSHELAQELAVQLGAQKLFFITDFNGITTGEYELDERFEITTDQRVHRMDLAEARRFLELNEHHAERPGVELVRRGVAAARGGVARVHIVDGRIDGVVLKEIFSNLGVGTMIHANVYDSIRPLTLEDISDVLRIMRPLVKSGVLVARSEDDLRAQLDDYVVFETDGTIYGCGALHEYEGGKAELAAIAVDARHAERGTGRKIVEYLLAQARRRGCRQVFALTTQTYDWFSMHGFYPGTVQDLPPGKRERYDRTRNSRILLHDL